MRGRRHAGKHREIDNDSKRLYVLKIFKGRKQVSKLAPYAMQESQKQLKDGQAHE